MSILLGHGEGRLGEEVCPLGFLPTIDISSMIRYLTCEKGVGGLTIDVEGDYTSWSCKHKLALQEKSEAVDEVRFPCTSCARENHSQRWGIDG